MPMSQERLDELLKEKKARAEIRNATLTVEKKKKIKGPEKKALNSWKKERKEFAAACKAGKSPKAGEYANFMAGLTPEGRDQEGRRVSFVERGKGRHNIDMLGSARGITRFSDGRVERLSR